MRLQFIGSGDAFGSGGRFNSFPLERTYMATSLSSNLLPFHTLLEDSAKCPKNSPAETLHAVAERGGEGTIASNGALLP